jgi:hypothetical protein
MGIIRNIVNAFKTVKKARDDFNKEIQLKSEEVNEEMKKNRRTSTIEFYDKVKNDKNMIMSVKRFDLFCKRITQSEYEKFEQKVNKALLDVENGKILKEDFYDICLEQNNNSYC